MGLNQTDERERSQGVWDILMLFNIKNFACEKKTKHILIYFVLPLYQLTMRCAVEPSNDASHWKGMPA